MYLRYQRILLLTLLLGAIIWLLYAVADYIYFHDHISFFRLLVGNLPRHEHTITAGDELLLRGATVALFVLFGLVTAYFMRRIERSETRLRNIFDNIIPICITDNRYRIISANRSYERIFGPIMNESGHIMCHDSRPGPKCRTDECPLHQITEMGRNLYTCESVKTEKDGDHHYIVTATPFLDEKGKRTGIIESFQDITPRRKLEKERELLIDNLQQALEKVKLLSGFLPICASCKKIRDDKGYWTQIESYIKNHSEAEFSHGICPECAEKLYGHLQQGRDGERRS